MADARSKKDQMIQEARQEAVQLLHDGKLVADKNMAERISTAQKNLESEKEQIISDKSKETEKINAIMLDREERIIELKEIVTKLRKNSGDT